jgi:hypothetical protein
MDNFFIDVTSEGRSNLERALGIAFSRYSSAYFWREDRREGSDLPRLVLSWVRDLKPSEGWHPFPTPVDAAAATDVVARWLEAAAYGGQPDHDGDNGKGWRVYTESWGHVAPYDYRALVAVEPRWAMYGK